MYCQSSQSHLCLYLLGVLRSITQEKVSPQIDFDK
ncbi:hypothetical protein F383_14146 [Gossypium arboreum]|uniref:Uncharacterized protein n=1 Tax=Gossypium arboreum TaxID=29729 RepID=A0A0B0PYJ3_GOSAR|nr:hypothetical protein F383_14146 [Gossypium arboreum]